MSFYNWEHHFRRRFTHHPAGQSPLGGAGLTGLYWTNAIRDIGLALVNIFIPIYLYRQFGNISLVFIFLAAYHLSVVLSAYPVARVIRKIGLDYSGVLGGLLKIGFFILLLASKTNPWLIWPAAWVWGLGVLFTWLVHHYYLAAGGGATHFFGQKVATITLIDRWLLSLIPIAGGVMLDWGGFQLTFMVAAVFLGISGLPLLFDKFNKKNMQVDLRDTLKGVVDPTTRSIWLALFAAGVTTEVVSTVWPIYLFLLIKNYTVIGMIQTGGLLLASMALVWLGRKVDHHSWRWQRPAIFINAANLLFRGLVISGMGLFLMESLYQLVSLFVWVPFDANVYELAVRDRRLEFFVRREWMLHLGGLISSLVLAVGFALGAPWQWMFVFGAVSLSMVAIGGNIKTREHKNIKALEH